MNNSKGIVYLVGAGPGDPSLLTLKGLWCLEQADVVVFDRLACEYLLTLSRPDAELIYVGKVTSRHTLPQEQINMLLVDKARKGKVVCRLKGGDPFVFGRGGEEAAVLVENDIPFEIVPGVTSAVSVPAYAGIPVTHRECASALSIVTGHRRKGCGGSVPLKRSEEATSVFLMGYENLNAIISDLLDEGWSSDTPAALIRWGTRADQQTVVGTLANIQDRAREEQCGPPAVFVVGKVVNLRKKLQWREKLPLFGKRIVITRPRHQAQELAQAIMMLGGEPLCLPAIELQPTKCDFDLSQLSSYDWVIFTSVNGVSFFLERLKSQKIDLRRLSGKLAAIGPATAASLESYGLQVDHVPEEYRAEALLEGLKDLIHPGSRVLIPRAQGARDVLPDGLRAMGVQVDILSLYTAVTVTKSQEWMVDILEGVDVDYLTFTSSSTVRSFVSLCKSEKQQLFSGKCRVACIGPVTAATAQEMGLSVDIVAQEYTTSGLLAALKADARGD